MPQMAPLMWTLLFMIFSLIMMIFSVINFYMKNPQALKFNFKKKPFYYTWKW